jgi:putative DNA-invertase from lambdoid prophage Rac
MRFLYARVSTGDQSVASQRHALGGEFDREFIDVGVSGAVMAEDRPAFGEMLRIVRNGDVIGVYSLDRIGRDALNVQAVIRRLLDAGVTVEVHGLGQIGRGVGEIIVAVLAQIADLERQKIAERTAAGRAAAREALQRTGFTHKGATSLGRPKSVDAAQVAAWRRANGASIAQTARHFGVSSATVKRCCLAAAA